MPLNGWSSGSAISRLVSQIDDPTGSPIWPNPAGTKKPKRPLNLELKDSGWTNQKTKS